MSRQERAAELMGSIRYQVFAPAVTTMGNCAKGCGKPARGAGLCWSCRTDQLAGIVGKGPAWAYTNACLRMDWAAFEVLEVAEGSTALGPVADEGKGGG